MQIIDTHCHVISGDESRYPRAPLGGKQSAWAQSRPLTAEQMVVAMDEAGIARAVLVQATTAYGYDNAYVLDCARRYPDRLIAVGTFDPLAPGAAARLTAALESGLAGVRLFTAGSTLSGQGAWFADSAMDPFWEAARETTICLQLRLDAASHELDSVLERFPAVRVLLDHCGYPDIAASPAAAEQSLPELVELAESVLSRLPESPRRAILAGTSRRLYPELATTAAANA
jgi:predicted TIM-barrel fold metal-dependent hydrolase